MGIHGHTATGTRGEPWIETSDVIPMFPSLVWKIQIRADLRATIDARLFALIARMRRDMPPLRSGQAWQSETTLHRLDELAELVACVSRACESVLRFLKTGRAVLDVTGCWATVLAPGAGHHAHSHPNNFLSAVYYLQTQAGADRLNFHDPRSQTGVIRPPVTELTAENTDQVVVPISNGTLLVFPAWLQHSVDDNQSDKERISISFNLMFSAFAENLSKPMW